MFDPGRVIRAVVIAVMAAALAGRGASAAPDARPRTVVVVVYEGVEILDFAGPMEVFHAAGGFGGLDGRAFRVVTAGIDGAPITANGVLRIDPEFSLEDCPSPDIIVVPGGDSRSLTENERFREWFGTEMRRAELVLSVCNGVRALADAGVLNGKRATTHHGVMAHFTRTFPEIEFVPDTRFVDLGPIVTTAGISAGIDGSLHVVARMLGREAALATAWTMEYDWRPSAEDSARYPRLNPSLDATGQMRQLAACGARRRNVAVVVEALSGLDGAGLANATDLFTLGQGLYGLGRFEAAQDVFERAIAGGYEDAGVAGYNRACCLALVGRPDAALAALREAIDAGWSNAALLATDSDLDSIRGRAGFEALARRLED